MILFHTHMFLPVRTHICTALIALLLLPAATAFSIEAPREQEFLVTAYYSPLPDQCCYVKGSLEADKILNGQGTHAADGTPVYAGMIAAPSSYAFGTRVELPGLGVFTVHDRGGAINEWENAHRIDIWVGSGEEGLARALAFGVRWIRGTVYPKGSDAPADRFAVERLSAPLDVLRPYLVNGSALLNVYPALGQKGLMVQLLQEDLRNAGYFDQEVTGFFGHATQRALAALIADTGIAEPDDRMTQITAAYLDAAIKVLGRGVPVPVPLVDAKSNAKDIAQAQRLLRSLGYYRGRTDGVYSPTFRSAILAYQQVRQLVLHDTDPGAGRIGPITRQHLTDAWRYKRIAVIAKETLKRERIREALAQRSLAVESMLSIGQSGGAVRRAQEVLADKGFFPREKINGVFGQLTKESVLRYQLDRGIVAGASDTGAGMIGPQTAAKLTEEQVMEAYRMVSAGGWSVL